MIVIERMTCLYADIWHIINIKPIKGLEDELTRQYQLMRAFDLITVSCCDLISVYGYFKMVFELLKK